MNNFKDTVSFELAQKAKSLGYPQDIAGKIISPSDAWDMYGLDYGLSSNSNDYEDYVKKIHPMDLQEWLRTKGIVMYVVPFSISSAGGWAYDIQQWKEGRLIIEKYQQAENVHHTFREALDMGLERGMDILIRDKEQEVALNEIARIGQEIEKQIEDNDMAEEPIKDFTTYELEVLTASEKPNRKIKAHGFKVTEFGRLEFWRIEETDTQRIKKVIASYPADSVNVVGISDV